MRRYLGVGAFWAVAAMLLLGRLGDGALRGSEDRWAEIAREMVLDGQWFTPRINWEPHVYKPLLTYWLVIATGRATGTLDEFAVRLPSALAGLIALAATVWLGRLRVSATVGRAAGWVLLTSNGFLVWARMGAADMENVAAIVLAVAWFFAREHRPGPALWFGFWLICAMGALMKGLAAVVVPLAVLAPHLVRAQRWRVHLRRAHLAAIAVAAAVYFGPFLAAEMTQPQSHVYMVFHENILRFFAPFDHADPVWTYAVTLPIMMLPWTPLLLVAAAVGVGAWRQLDSTERWLLESTAIVFALFTASGSRRSYYILPILPFAALLVATLLDGRRARHAVAAALWLTRLVVLGAACVALASPVLWLVARLTGTAAPFTLALATALLGGAALALGSARSSRGMTVARAVDLDERVAAVALPAALLLGGFFLLDQPYFDSLRTKKPFALALREASQGVPTGSIAFVGHVPGLYPFYMQTERPIRVLRAADEVFAFAREGSGLLVASPDALARLGAPLPAELLKPPTLSEPTLRWAHRPGHRLSAWRLGRRGAEGAEHESTPR